MSNKRGDGQPGPQHGVGAASVATTGTATGGAAGVGDVEDGVIRLKLLLREMNLRRFTIKFLAWCELVDKNTDPHDCYELQQSLIRELNMYEFVFQKADVALKTYQEEKEAYDALCAKRVEEIAQIEREILDLTAQLEDEKVSLQHNEEYAALKRAISERPPSQDSEREIASLEKELADLQQSAEDVSIKLDTRSKQFALLMHALSQLSSDVAPTTTDTNMRD
ncbi:THO complex subunit 7B [Pelomyxa schiedti]|nr:THO complex subunit 7B [Pelomyxa schiedti]